MVSKGKISRVQGLWTSGPAPCWRKQTWTTATGSSWWWLRAVALRLPKGNGHLDIPSEALLMKGEEAFAATLEGGQVHLQPLILGDDVGSRVRVLQGLATGPGCLNPIPVSGTAIGSRHWTKNSRHPGHETYGGRQTHRQQNAQEERLRLRPWALL